MKRDANRALAPLPPLVSVIIPVYNGERFLREAIDSVLAQTYQPFELIIVDDGSTDRSGEIARSYSGVKHIHQSHRGIGAARNRGAAEATGEYLAFLDADDLWMPEKLSLQVAALLQDPDLQVVSGLVEQFVEPGLEGRYAIPKGPQPGYVSSSTTVRRSWFDALGSFQEDTLTPEVEWFARMLDHAVEVRILPRVVARRRIHGANQSIRMQQATLRSTMRLLRSSIARKRAGKRRAAGS